MTTRLAAQIPAAAARGARAHRAAVRAAAARPVAQHRHHGGGARHRRDGAQSLHRLYRPGLVRPRRLVRHRRLCRRADPAATGSAARSGCRCCCRWSSSPSSSTVVGVIILRRRGVYFSLLTLALAALTYTIAFRWTAVTGGEDGLGGLKRGSIGPFSLDNALTYYIVVARDRPRRALSAAAAGALAVRPCAGGDPREPAARHVPGLSGRALQARRVRDLGRGDRASPARCSASRTISSRPKRSRCRSPANCWRWS